MIPLGEARARVLRDCHLLPAEVVAVDDALGLVTAEEIDAPEDVPPFANTAMDGFAVVAADTVGATPERPVRLPVIGTIAAGTQEPVTITPGTAARIMTGAAIPRGADAVVMVELCSPSADGTEVEIQAQVPVGNHVRPAGDDLKVGDPVIAAGVELTAGRLGLLAGVGRRTVRAVRRARVGVMSTGDELVEGDEALAPGQIRDANRHSLLALVRGVGCDAVDLGIVRDDEQAIADAITRGAATCDALVTSGGVSMGDFDYVKVVLDRLGDMDWMQVAIRPAKPLAFGTVDGVPVFGLPGNPVSSMVSFELFARPGLRRMMGHEGTGRTIVHALADDGLPRRPDGKTHLVRVLAAIGDDGRVHVRSAGGQGSHQLSAMAAATALAVVPDGDGVAPGEAVETILVDQP